MPSFKRFDNNSLNENNIAFVRNINLFINSLLDSDGISLVDLNSFQCMEKIKKFINSSELNSQSISSFPEIRPDSKPKPKLKHEPEVDSEPLKTEFKANGVEKENNIDSKSENSQNFQLFAEECKQNYEDLYENHLIESEMMNNFKEIKNTLECKFKDFVKSSNADHLNIEFENLLSELLNQSILKMNSDVKEFENYIINEKNDYINKIIQHLNIDSLLNFEEIEKLHNSIKENKMRSFDEFSKNYKSAESFKNLLIEKLDEEYEKFEINQQVFIRFRNSIVSKFNNSICFSSKYAEELFNETRIEFIKELSSKDNINFNEIFVKIFNETLEIFLKYNNDINSREACIAKKNVSTLITLYSKKFSEEIENNSFQDLTSLEKYNNEFVEVCIESLNAGLELRDISVKIKIDSELKENLSSEFEKIKDLFQHKVGPKIIEKSIDLYEKRMILETSEYNEPLAPEDLLNIHNLKKMEVISLSNYRGLNSQNVSLLEKEIEKSYQTFVINNDELRKQLISRTVIAIDFGTCNIRVGYVKDSLIIILKAIPNYIGFHGRQVLIGEEALKFAQIDPKNVIFHSKLFIGGSDPKFHHFDLYPFEVKEFDDKFNYFRVDFDGKQTDFSCEEIISLILKKVKEMCELELGTNISECVITVPNSFNDSQREAMKISAQIAGFNATKLVNDITAAAIFLQNDIVGQREIIIANSGSSSFSIALMSMDSSEKIIRVQSLKSDHVLNCSGIAIDNESMRKRNFRNPNDCFKMRKDFEREREKVSSNTYAAHYKKSLSEISKLLNNKYQDFILDVNKSSDGIIREIYLTGGYFKFKLFKDVHPMIQGTIIESDNIVVEGAAIYAHSLRRNRPTNERQFEIEESLNLTISTKDLLMPRKISFLDKIFSSIKRNEAPKFIIPRNTRLITSFLIPWNVYFGNIDVYQGEFVFPSRFKNQRIGTFNISSTKRAQPQCMSFKLTMSDEGIISIDEFQNGEQLPPIRFSKFKFSEEKIQSCLERFNRIFE
jgi:hypothetical protein